MLVDDRAVAGVVLIESDALVGTAQKLCQDVFPPLNRQRTQVVAIKLDQIERAEYGSVVMAPVAQEVEDREAALIDHDGFAIDEARLHR
jgi:hypothetical protein